MEFAKVTAIIRPDALERVEQSLQALGVPGISVSKTKGYGEYADFYSTDWMTSCVRVEVIVREPQAEEVAETIMEAAYTGLDGDGLVVISPIFAVYHIRMRKRCEGSVC